MDCESYFTKSKIFLGVFKYFISLFTKIHKIFYKDDLQFVAEGN